MVVVTYLLPTSFYRKDCWRGRITAVSASKRHEEGDKMLQILNPFRAGQEFQKLKSEKKWMLALVIVFIPGLLSLVGDVLTQQKVVDFTTLQMEEMGLAETLFEASETLRGLLFVSMIFYSIIFILVAWILKSVAFHLFSKILGGEKAEISSIAHLIAFTYLPFVFKGFLDVYRGLTYQILSYEEFTSPVEFTEAFLSLLREYSIFFPWVFILMVIAVREQYSLNNIRAFFVVLIPYTGYFLVQIILMFFSYQFIEP